MKELYVLRYVVSVTGLLWWYISILRLFPLSFGDVGSGRDRFLIVGPPTGRPFRLHAPRYPRLHVTQSPPLLFQEFSSHHVTRLGPPGCRLNILSLGSFLRALQETVLNQLYTVALFLT